MKKKMDDMKIRLAKKKDLKDLTELKFGLDAHHKDYPIWPPECDLKEARRAMMRELNDRKKRIFVAESASGELVGIMTVRTYRRETRHEGYQRIAEIGWTYVREGHRNMGIGRSLMGKCIEYAEKNGAKHVTLRSVVFNKIGNRFWDSFGIRPLLYIRSTTLEKVKEGLRK